MKIVTDEYVYAFKIDDYYRKRYCVVCVCQTTWAWYINLDYYFARFCFLLLEVPGEDSVVVDDDGSVAAGGTEVLGFLVRFNL